MFTKVPSIFTILIYVFALHGLPAVVASDAEKDDLPSNTTANGDPWISSDPEDLQPMAGTSWLNIYHLEDFEWADRVVIGDQVFTFQEDGTVYLECYDLLGNFWGIVQYGELGSHGGDPGYMISYYTPGVGQADGEFYFWDFIKTNGLETGMLVIEAEDTGSTVGPLPNIGLRIHQANYTPFVMPDLTGDDEFGLADVIWSLQLLSGLR
jgi:hypothetical protein